jgi:hypothetical protein
MNQALFAAVLIALGACAPRHAPMRLMAACRFSSNIYADAAGQWWTADDDRHPITRVAPGAKLEDVCK